MSDPGEGGEPYTLPIGVCAARRGHDFGAKTLCQTTTDAKSRRSSFCRKKPGFRSSVFGLRFVDTRTFCLNIYIFEFYQKRQNLPVEARTDI